MITESITEFILLSIYFLIFNFKLESENFVSATKKPYIEKLNLNRQQHGKQTVSSAERW